MSNVCPPTASSTEPTVQPASALLPPCGPLTACARAFYWHDLPHGVPLLPTHRLSWIPPNPYVSLVWLVSGDAVLVQAHGQACEHLLPRVFVAGPTRHGWRSTAISAYRSFGLVLQPAAFALMTGTAMDKIHVPTQDAHELLDTFWHKLLDDVAAAPDHLARKALCESFLTARWAATRPAQSAWARLSEQAWRHPAQVAALTALNWTARHFQRRTRALTSMSPGEVARMIRLEQALLELREGRASRAQVAVAHGYADQPHFTRDVRNAYGRSPGKLLSDVADADNHGDWLLRL